MLILIDITQVYISVIYRDVRFALFAIITSPPTYHNYYITIICAGFHAEPIPVCYNYPYIYIINY